MNLEQHCEKTKEIFGESYTYVHNWLDEFSNKYSEPDRYKHRKYRHHLEGILEARKEFGEIGMLVAFLHVFEDNEGYIPIKSDYNIPEYED